jgi:hypothetical protein
MLRASGFDQWIEALADPEQATDLGSSSFRTTKDHQSRRRDVAKPPTKQFTSVETIENIVLEGFHSEQAGKFIKTDP